jgi:RsiW-degrading membrane proteinase PrsW (M82 family)
MGWEIPLLAAVTATLPTLAYLALIWWVDRHEKEPFHLLAVTFLWGAVPAAVLAVVLDVMIDLPLQALGDAAAEWRSAHLLAPVIEESVKGAAVLMLALRARREFNGVLDGIVYGAVVGLGFALTENFFAYMTAFATGSAASGLLIVTLRGIVFGLNHPLFSALPGAGLGWALTHGSRWRAAVPVACLFGAIALHVAHNALAAGALSAWWSVPLATLADWAGLALLAVLVTLAWRHEQRWIEEGLRDELLRGTITSTEYHLARSYPRRVAAEWRALQQAGWSGYWSLVRHLQTLTKLAFARYHLRHGRYGSPERVAALQQAVRRGRLALARDDRLHLLPGETKHA